MSTQSLKSIQLNLLEITPLLQTSAILCVDKPSFFPLSGLSSFLNSFIIFSSTLLPPSHVKPSLVSPICNLLPCPKHSDKKSSLVSSSLTILSSLSLSESVSSAIILLVCSSLNCCPRFSVEFLLFLGDYKLFRGMGLVVLYISV